MQIFVDIEYVFGGQIVSFHLFPVNYHWKNNASSKTVNPYNLSYINAVRFCGKNAIILRVLVLSPTPINHLKGRNYGMLFFCNPSKEMETFIWRHNTYFDCFLFRKREREHLKPSLVLLNVFKTTKVAVIDSYCIYMDTKDIIHLLLSDMHLKIYIWAACGAKWLWCFL